MRVPHCPCAHPHSKAVKVNRAKKVREQASSYTQLLAKQQKEKAEQRAKRRTSSRRSEGDK